MVLNADEFKAKGEFKKDDLISDVKDKLHPKEYVEAENIDRYIIKQIRYLEWDTDRVPSKVRRPTFPELYNRPKLIRGTTNDAIYDDSGLVCNHGGILFVPFDSLKNVENLSINSSIQKWNKKERKELEKTSKNYDLKYILAILNSKFARFYLNTIRRHRIEYYFYPDDLKNLPIKSILPNDQKPFIQKADVMISKNKELLECKNDFIKLLVSDFKIEKLTEKLENWYLLEWSDFSNELKKKKTVLEEEQEVKWLKRFDRMKKEALAIKNVIDSTDREIDKMVYELYKLTEEEIRIVEDEES